MKYLPIWPRAQNFKFDKNIKNFPSSKLDKIENFFKKKYNSKYCVLTSSARVGLILVLKFKKFDRSKIVNVPKWSSHCIYDAIGSITNISCQKNFRQDCTIIFHQLGRTFKFKSDNIIIDDSADSLPNENFIPYINSNFVEIISIPKIIGSFCGGLILTNSKNLYNFTKNLQKNYLELSRQQSYKKFICILKEKKNFEWHYKESQNYSVDENTILNVYDNLKNFDLNKKLINERKNKYFNIKKISLDKYRIGPCLIINYKKKNDHLLEVRRLNNSNSRNIEKFSKFNVLPLHFTITDNELEKKIYEISKY
jgi:putative PLP-dependent aminotransferase (TIGR04422 family)